MISSSILKLSEMHVFSVLKERLFLNKLQFGFFDNLFTIGACMTLKEVVNYNIGKRSNVYAYFIDLTRAFNMVDHFHLGKLLE